MELREPFDGPRLCYSHKHFDQWLEDWQEENGELPIELIDQVHRLFASILFRGQQRFSIKLIEFGTNSLERKKWQKLVKDCPYLYVVRRYSPKVRCHTWGICNLEGLVAVSREESDALVPTFTVSSPAIPVYSVLARLRSVYSIPEDRQLAFAEMWRAYCISEGLPVSYDWDGSTDYGHATFRSMDAVSVPAVLSWDDCRDDPKSLAWSRQYIYRLTHGLIRRSCHRIYGRLYHGLVNAPRWVRRQFRMRHNGRDGPVAEVDMSSTYWVLLCSMLPDCAEKAELASVLAGAGGRDFYMELDGACDVPYCDRNKVKQKVQSQCLFRTVWKYQGFPLWQALRKFNKPLARLIDSMRSVMDGTDFSEVLTRREASFFVDHLLPMVHGMGIPCLTVHDALLVPACEAERVKDLCCKEAFTFFGFTPKFGVTYGKSTSTCSEKEETSLS